MCKAQHCFIYERSSRYLLSESSFIIRCFNLSGPADFLFLTASFQLSSVMPTIFLLLILLVSIVIGLGSIGVIGCREGRCAWAVCP